MNQQYRLAPASHSPHGAYTHELPGQMMYTPSPGRVSVNPPNAYVVTPSMRPSSTMVDENGEHVEFYPAMSARPSVAPSYASARPSFAPHQDIPGDSGYTVANGQYVVSGNYYQPAPHSEDFSHTPVVMAAHGGSPLNQPAPVPPAPHLWTSVVPGTQSLLQRQQSDASRSAVAPSLAMPSTVSPTLQRLLHLQRAGSRGASTPQEHPSVEKVLMEAEAFFAEMEATEQQLVDALEAAQMNVEKGAPEHDAQGFSSGKSPQKRQAEAGGGELSGSFSCTSVATSVGAGAAGEDSGTAASRGASSQDRVKQDLAFCTDMVKTAENAATSLRTLEATNRRIQQYFLVDKYHGNKQSFFQRLHRRVDASTTLTRADTRPTATSAHEAEMQSREDAVCDRLLADILMQRHFVPHASDISGDEEQGKPEADRVRICTPHTKLRMLRFSPTQTSSGTVSQEVEEEVPLLLITVPARAVAVFEATNAAGGMPVAPASSTVVDTTALTTPARYTQMQLLEVISDRLEAMRRRVGALEQRRATELQEVEARLRQLDAYDPSTDELHASRERIRREMGLFQGWLDHMATLKARLLAAEQELFQSVLEVREIRRQLLRVLEQRLQEDTHSAARPTEGDEEPSRDTVRSDQVRFSHASHSSDRASTGDPTESARRSTQRPQLPRASTVFLAMLQRMSDEQKASHDQQQPHMSSTLSSPVEERSTTETTSMPPVDALRATAPPLQATSFSTVANADSETTAQDTVAVAQAMTIEEHGQHKQQQQAGRRRSRDEMEATAPTTTVSTEQENVDNKPHKTGTHSPHSSSAVSVSSSSANDDDRDDAYEEPLPFAFENEESREPSTELNHEEYSLRSGKLLSGVKAFVRSVVKRAITFSDDDSNDDSDDSDDCDAVSRPVKRHRTE